MASLTACLRAVSTRRIASTSTRTVTVTTAIRHASSSAAVAELPPTEQSPQVVPTQDEMAEDPQLAGLGYPQIPQISRQLRAPHLKWWDPQERINFGEVLPENDDALSMWAPDTHPKVPGYHALGLLGIASLVMTAFAGAVYLITPDIPASKRTYPYDGLVKELSGTDDQTFAAVVKGKAGSGSDGEEEEEEE